jgi:hypothetical protein
MFDFNLWHKSLNNLVQELRSKGWDSSRDDVNIAIKKHLSDVKKSQYTLGEIAQLYIEYGKALGPLHLAAADGDMIEDYTEELLKAEKIIQRIEVLTKKLEISEKKEK